MKKFLFLCLVITGGIMLPSCESDDAPQPFIPDSVRLNPEDSIIMMDLYRDMRISEQGNPRIVWTIRHPDFWKGVTYEYDEESGLRYVTGIEANLEWADSLPSYISRLTHLRNLRLTGVPNTDRGIPREIFTPNLENLALTGIEIPKDAEYIPTEIPREIFNLTDCLKTLTLSNLCITRLPEGFERFSHLEECVLSNNRLSGKVPEFFADFTGTVALNGNYFSEFDWQWVRDGRNVPNCTANAITNDAPEWMMESYLDVLKAKFPDQKSDLWVPINAWMKAHNKK